MAFTMIADIFSPEVLADQISARFPDMLVLGNTNLVSVDSSFPLGSPGTRFTMPFWNRIGTLAPMTEGTPLTPGKITSNVEHATVQRAGIALEVLDTSKLVSRADPVSEIADQLARRSAEYLDAALVVQLGLTPNVYDQTTTQNKTNTGSELGDVNQNTFVAAMTSTVGDSFMRLISGGARIFMHSKVFGDLLQTGAIQNQYQSGLDSMVSGMIPTLNGLRIEVSDLVTTTTVSGVTKYKSYIVGPGALELMYQRQVKIEFDRDIFLQADAIAATVHFAAHLKGYDDLTNAPVVEQNKSIPVVAVTSN